MSDSSNTYRKKIFDCFTANTTYFTQTSLSFLHLFEVIAIYTGLLKEYE